MLETHLTQAASPANHTRLDALDALRAIAVLLVITLHIAEQLAGPSTCGRPPFICQPLPNGQLQLPFASQWGMPLAHWAHWLDFGRIGVVLFFAISGFVIPFSLRPTQTNALRNFALHRFFRLYPAYWLSIIVSAWLVWCVHDGLSLNTHMLRVMLVNATMLQGFTATPDVLGLYWTLKIELIFYILCATLHWLGALHNPRLIILAAWALLLTSKGAFGPHLTYTPAMGEIIQNLSIMLWGCACRHMFDRTLSKPARLMVIAYCVAQLTWPLRAYWLHSHHHVGDMAWIMQAISYASACALFWLGTFMLPLRLPPLAWVGRVSYSAYLFHPAVLYLSVYLLKKAPSSFAMPMPFWLITIMALTLLCSAASHHWIERPAIRLGRRLTPALAPNKI